VRVKVRALAAVGVGFVSGALPCSNWMARRVGGIDLRTVGTGTVSGSGLYEVAGFRPLAGAGILDVAKGAVGPALAGRQSAGVAAWAAGAAVAGHNWSPLLGGAGGRGLSPAIGALAVTAPVGSAVVLAGLAGGRLAGETALGTLVALAALVPVVRRVHGREAGWAATAVLVPMLAKRLAGNRRPAHPGLAPYGWRLLYDRDEP